MLSILLPEYNYDCTQLVGQLAQQCVQESISFEIIVMDDASKKFKNENRAINALPGCRFVEENENKGIAITRNKLAEMANYPWLLLLDCDLEVLDSLFIRRYLDHLDEAQVLIGSIVYQTERPPIEQRLRWEYGRKRESLPFAIRSQQPWKSMSTPNILMHKTVHERVPFDETVIGYGHEDSCWSYQLRKQGITIKHIDNPLMHKGLDYNDAFLQKSLEATSKYTTPPFNQENALIQQIRLFKVYENLRKRHLDGLVGWLQNKTQSRIRKNLAGPKPSLLLFDFFRLGYLCRLVKFVEAQKRSS
jgi:glycosyltransferase involved in cell wall biosynthesis